MEIIAHRGASREAPENTLAAVNLAWRQNADAVEVDVHLSKCGQIVVIHDASTRKTGGLRRMVGSQSLEELKALDVGSWKSKAWAGERIPTLKEVLATIPPGKRLFIEVKCGPECVQEFANVVQSSGKGARQIVAIGFSLDTMARLKRKLPDIEICWIAELKRSWKTGRWSPQPATLIDKAKTARLDGLDLGARGPITAQFVEQVKKANLSLYVWTVDSPARAKALARAGVDGITTNRPGWLRERLS